MIECCELFTENARNGGGGQLLLLYYPLYKSLTDTPTWINSARK